jgi:regulator of cell morphogenesis and NO signaling
MTTSPATQPPELSRSLADLVTERPIAARVLYQLGLDYCCGGRRSLAEACAERGLDPRGVLAELDQSAPPQEPASRWDQRPVAELVEHIVARYHVPLRQEIPRLVALARKVETVHADKPTAPIGLTLHLEEVQRAVEDHLAKEEEILFPLLVAGRGHLAHTPAQAVIAEHDDHARDLRHTRALTRNLTVPAEACGSWRELYRALGELERELMDHIHLENNVLLPRALLG